VFDPAKYTRGSGVRVADRATLDAFFRDWKLHHRLSAEQLDYAGRVAIVVKYYMYHGGDMLYELEGLPGLWHEQLLVAAA
jgi:hypothetical protein